MKILINIELRKKVLEKFLSKILSSLQKTRIKLKDERLERSFEVRKLIKEGHRRSSKNGGGQARTVPNLSGTRVTENQICFGYFFSKNP